MNTAQIITGVVVFVFGACVGSFLNVCIWRIPRGLSISRPLVSMCPKCRHSIRFYDNIPLLSYVLLGGRCRDCGAKISARYPLIEALTAVIFVALYYFHGVLYHTDPGHIMVLGLVLSLLLVAAAVDAEFFIIPDEISIFGMVGGLLAGFLLPRIHVGDAAWHSFGSVTGLLHLDGLLGSMLGVFAGGGLVFLFAVAGKAIFGEDALGMGDVKLMAMVGAFTGWKVACLSFFIAPFFGLFYGLPLLIFRKRHVMPYGPFLAIASCVVILGRSWFCGVLDSYLGLISELWNAPV
jgi:leader peptidase (prepilin peptidase)/N-methyltransferase